jgi:hypothetical protein
VTSKLYEAFAAKLSEGAFSIVDDENGSRRIRLTIQPTPGAGDTADELAVARADVKALRETVRSLSAALERKDQEVVARGELILDQANAIFAQRNLVKELRDEVRVLKHAVSSLGDELAKASRETVGEMVLRLTGSTPGCRCGGRDCPNP